MVVFILIPSLTWRRMKEYYCFLYIVCTATDIKYSISWCFVLVLSQKFGLLCRLVSNQIYLKVGQMRLVTMAYTTHYQAQKLLHRQYEQPCLVDDRFLWARCYFLCMYMRVLCYGTLSPVTVPQFDYLCAEVVSNEFTRTRHPFLF